MQLFYSRGVRATSVEEIAFEAGVTKPTLYRNYPSKEKLVEHCVAAAAQTLIDDIALSAPAGTDPVEALRIIVRYFADDTTIAGQRLRLLLNASIEYPASDHPIFRIAAETARTLRDRIENTLRPLTGDDSVTTADHIWLLIKGASARCHALGPRHPAEALLRSVEAVLKHWE